ncbi:hypothetical protein [Kitasatospora sp. GAS1066B]|uniref:hypothetical protein n=1 Tax=Kitasatospora sp. GAS1066B TaxID=3156271 RepID=UPI003517EC0E
MPRHGAGVGDEGGVNPADVEQVLAPVPDGELLGVRRPGVRAGASGKVAATAVPWAVRCHALARPACGRVTNSARPSA